jgi:hypothetical protein
MNNSNIKAAIIIAVALVLCSLIVMFPTYRCMLILSDGSGSDVVCVINAK